MDGPNGSDFVTPQDICFAVLHRPHAGPEEAVSENAENQYQREYLRHSARMAASHELGKDDEKHQREQIIEKQHGLLPQSQPHVTTDEGKVRFQSRNLRPVISMNTSSSVGCFRLTSTNSSPCWSIHMINSTKVAAGRRETTVSVRPVESVWVFTVSGHCG